MTLDITGPLNTGTVSVPLTSDNDGWNLVGNPFISAINWEQVVLPTGVSDAIYVWVHNPLSWKYAAYVDKVSVNGGAKIVPSMQGFHLFEYGVYA